MIRHLRVSACICGLIVLGVLCVAKPQAACAAKPNVLFIAIDDLNDWVGCMGGHPQAHTPNIDRLAARGVLFTNAHCQAPICGPSRASLMTGLYPHTTGIYGQINSRNLAKHPMVQGSDTPYLPNWFAKHGYTTMAAGKLFHGDSGVDAFEHYVGGMGGFGPKPAKGKRFHYTPLDPYKGKGTQTDWGAFPDSDADMPDTKVAKWAVEQLGKRHDGPVFIAPGFWRPHVPWYVPEHWIKRYEPVDKVALPPVLDEDYDDLPPIAAKVHELGMMPTLKWLRENDQHHRAVAWYLACIEFVDSRVGMVLDALDKSSIADDTVIVLWSDHGYHLGEKDHFAKHSVWEESTKVVMIVVPPRGAAWAKRGVTCDASVGLIDLYPTLVELCGLPANPANEGRSLVPLLKDPGAAWDRPILTTYGRTNHSIRDQRYRYIRYEDGGEELYDHEADPNEWHNLAGAAAHAATKARLRERLPQRNAPWHPASDNSVNPYFDEHMKRHSDPSLK